MTEPDKLDTAAHYLGMAEAAKRLIGPQLCEFCSDPAEDDDPLIEFRGYKAHRDCVDDYDRDPEAA